MAEPGKKKPIAAQAPALGAPLSEHPILFHAVENFIRENSNFESSTAVTTAVDDTGARTDIMSVFTTPIRHKLFTMDTALQWVLFLSLAGGRAVQEGDAPFADAAGFSARDALGLIASVYDTGVQVAVWDHFEPDEEEEDSGAA